MTTQETPEPGTEAGRRLLQGWGGQAKPSVREVLAIEAEARAAVLAELKPCPWCGHPPMCHKGQEGECPGDTLSDGGPTDG